MTNDRKTALIQAAIMAVAGIAALYTAAREWDWFIAAIGLVLISPAVGLGWAAIRKVARHAP